MALVARRFLTVGVGLFLAFMVVQALLSRDEKPVAVLEADIALHGPEGEHQDWSYSIDEVGLAMLNGEPSTAEEVTAKLASFEGEYAVTARAGEQGRWTFASDGGDSRTFNGAPATMADLAKALGGGVRETRPVTVSDVMAVHIPSPTVENISFPDFSYRQAFPDAPDDIKVIEIDTFAQAPMLEDMDSMPGNWREHYPASLPPVKDRLPRNPAVIRGPDGIGQYGGVWRRCTGELVERARCIRPESFTRFDPSGQLMPAIAYKWEVDDGNRVFTFHLRKGHRWSDGYPFTTDDILWVCNTLIGSDYWLGPPNWMQATDGSAVLYEGCILDWPGLVKMLRGVADADDPSPVGSILQIGGEEFATLLAALPADREPDAMQKYRLIDQLNQIIRDKEFLANAGWDSVDNASDIANLERKGVSRLSKDELERLTLLHERNDLLRIYREDPSRLGEVEQAKLNLAMFRLAFGDVVDVARKKRVKVEAVADENGDTSHIVRFTFPRPNSIFLEKTATFMFYRGIFELSKHFTSQYHPQGSKVLNRIDIFDWDELTDRIRRQAASDAPSPGKQLWALLSEDIRNNLPNSGTDDAAKQRFVDAVNAALESPAFFRADAWGGGDLDAELAGLLANGYAALRRDPAGGRRVRQLLVREDLLKRVAAEGMGSLSDDERFQLNLAMFRAAYARQGEDSPVAGNREQALNRVAKNHPRRYSSWVKLMYALRNFHPTENPHMPTLRAWRNISEKMDSNFVIVRNPYYYKVDEMGNQLPYIDAIETLRETEKPNILLKMSAGSVDFQMREINFEHFTYLKQHESSGGYTVRLWAHDQAGGVVLMPCQAHKNEAFRQLQDDSRFRHALSLAINREEIIDVCFAGMATPAQAAVPAGSPYYTAYHAKMSVDYDPDQANRLLDQMGLDKRTADGVRLTPDGQPLILNIDASSQDDAALLMMVGDFWKRIGIDARLKFRSGQLIGRMLDIGIADITVKREGASYFGPLLAGGFAPTHSAECPQWKPWVDYLRDAGRRGWFPPARMREIELLWENVLGSADEQAKRKAWDALARRTADDLPRIGTVAFPGVIVYQKNNFKNVPELALAGWIAHSPGNACPEVFFFGE